jgi:hypothetical protein
MEIKKKSCHPYYKHDTQNPLRFNRRKMINTEKSKPHKQTTRTITNAAMLVLLRRLFRDALTFCAFEIIWERKTAEQRH